MRRPTIELQRGDSMYDNAMTLDVVGRILMAGFFVATAILNMSKA